MTAQSAILPYSYIIFNNNAISNYYANRMNETDMFPKLRFSRDIAAILILPRINNVRRFMKFFLI
ncbi:hypothetical protein N836_29950 [Leptolyngbya sp. Heron Island J]|nr:hypothetical protein N836_29950 [Leptolyngbya sp. Heron Island J]